MSFFAPTRSSLFSRLLVVVALLMIIGLGYWFVQTSFAPVPVPSAAVSRGTVRFDPALDVSKNELFFHLRPLGDQDIQLPNLGRPNPFIPIPPPPVATTSTSSTPSAPAAP